MTSLPSCRHKGVKPPYPHSQVRYHHTDRILLDPPCRLMVGFASVRSSLSRQARRRHFLVRSIIKWEEVESRSFLGTVSGDMDGRCVIWYRVTRTPGGGSGTESNHLLHNVSMATMQLK